MYVSENDNCHYYTHQKLQWKPREGTSEEESLEATSETDTAGADVTMTCWGRLFQVRAEAINKEGLIADGGQPCYRGPCHYSVLLVCVRFFSILFVFLDFMCMLHFNRNKAYVNRMSVVWCVLQHFYGDVRLWGEWIVCPTWRAL